MSEAPRTVFASAALRVAGTLTAEVHDVRLGRAPVRVVKVLEPEGPSTHGGKLARLSIVLAPETGEGKALMCGWIDVGSSEAELRPFEVLAEQFKARHGQPIDIDRTAYDAMLGTIRSFLEGECYSVSTASSAPSASVPAGAETAKSQAAGVARESRMNGFVIAVALVSFLLGGVVGALVAGMGGG
ncbi:MAG: hypothetical protein ACOCVR_02000 [Myxococcota bacterium]